MRRCLPAESTRRPSRPSHRRWRRLHSRPPGTPPPSAQAEWEFRGRRPRKIFSHERGRTTGKRHEGEISGPGIGKSFTFMAKTAISGFRRLGRDGARIDRRARRQPSLRRPERRGCPTQGSWRPFVAISVSAPERSMVRRGVRIEEVGLTAKRATTGWPVEIPPSIPPAWFDKKSGAPSLPRRISSALASPESAGGGKTVADLDALDRVDRHKSARQFRVELAIDWRAPARRHILGHDLDDGADGGPCLADGIEIGLEKCRRLGIGAKERIFDAPRPNPNWRDRSCADPFARARRGSAPCR